MDSDLFCSDLKTTVSCLRKGRTGEAAKAIPAIVKGLKDLAASQDPAQLKTTAIIIRGIVDGFQRKDYVLMADLLEYEVLPLMVRA